MSEKTEIVDGLPVAPLRFCFNCKYVRTVDVTQPGQPPMTEFLCSNMHVNRDNPIFLADGKGLWRAAGARNNRSTTPEGDRGSCGLEGRFYEEVPPTEKPLPIKPLDTGTEKPN